MPVFSPQAVATFNSGKASGAVTALVVAFLFSSVGEAVGEPSFLDVVQKYADTMIERGRDTYGPQKSGLLLSALDRLTLTPLTVRPAPPGGLRREDRPGQAWSAMTGTNPHLDENLLRVFYTLTEITGNPRYARVADEELTWFLNNTQSPVTGLFPWGEHLCWDVMIDKPVSGGDVVMHEFARPWLLWDRCYQLAPGPSLKFAMGLWEHQIADHKTGGYDRHAPYFTHGPVDGKDFPRHGGFYIGTWCYAYKHSKDPVYLEAIEAVLGRFERKRVQRDGSIVATSGPLDLGIAAAMVPDPLASRLRKFAAEEDNLMLADIKAHPIQTGRNMAGRSLMWGAAYGGGSLASSAMYYLARYEQVHKRGYRDAVIAIARAYLDSLPEEDVDVWPMTFGHAISTEVAAYHFTKKDVYLERAKKFGQMAVDIFWQDKPLPRASFKTGHYESLSGPDTLALALLQLHAAIHHLTVAIPSNSIDR